MKHGWIRSLEFALLLAALAFCLCSCSTPQQEQPVETERPKQPSLFVPVHTDPPVILGGAETPRDTRELTLLAGTFTYDELRQAMELLPELQEITLPETELSMREIRKLREAGLTVNYTVALGSQILEGDAVQADLSGLSPEELPQVLGKLELLPELSSIELMNAAGESRLSKTDVRALMDALPWATIHYEFDLFGQHLSTLDTRVVYDSVEIGNKGVPEVREAMDILTDCEYFLLDSCGIDNELMAQLRDEHPEMKVVWRVFFKDCNVRTDAHVLRVTFELVDGNSGPLKYCTDAVFADFGHNDKMTDVTFLAYMPNLECVILSGSSIRDISPMANCKRLEWVEMCFCGLLKDISVFRDHPTLRFLNISMTGVTDISMLDNVPLERFNCMCRVGQLAQRHFWEMHPDCIAVYYGTQPFGYGWRYNDAGYTFFSYYTHMREVFRYDEEEYFGNHKGVHEDDELV